MIRVLQVYILPGLSAWRCWWSKNTASDKTHIKKACKTSLQHWHYLPNIKLVKEIFPFIFSSTFFSHKIKVQIGYFYRSKRKIISISVFQNYILFTLKKKKQNKTEKKMGWVNGWMKCGKMWVVREGSFIFYFSVSFIAF